MKTSNIEKTGDSYIKKGCIRKNRNDRYHGNLRRYYYSTLKFLRISVRDKVAYFWVIGYPLLFILIWFIAFNTGSTRAEYHIAIINEDPYALESDNIAVEGFGNVSGTFMELFDPDTGNKNITQTFILHSKDTAGNQINRSVALNMLEKSRLDAVIIFPRDFSEIIIGNTNWYSNLEYLDPSEKADLELSTGMDLDYLDSLNLTSGLQASFEIHSTPDTIGQTIISSVFNGIINDIMLAYNGLERIETQKFTVTNIEYTMFDYYSPGFVIVGVLVAVMMIGIKFGQEKEKGLMERLDTTPVPRYIHLLAGGTAQLIYSSVQIAIVLIVLNIAGVQSDSAANWGLAYLNALTVAFSCVGLGLIVAAVAKSSDGAGGLAWLFIIPFQFLSGSFFPLGGENVSKYIPTSYSIEAMRQIILFGAGFSEVWEALSINIVFGIVTCIIGAIIFTKKSKI